MGGGGVSTLRMTGNVKKSPKPKDLSRKKASVFCIEVKSLNALRRKDKCF